MHRLNFSFDTDLVDALATPAAFGDPVDDIELVETHISWLILAGDYAYKIKKPIVLDFLDFGDLDKRRHYCEEEIRLNRLWAPEIYLDVVPITLEDGQPRFGGSGAAIEFAVRMRRFDQRMRLDLQLERGELSVDDMRELAINIAARHERAPVVAAGLRKRVLASTKQFIGDNFTALESTAAANVLDSLRVWNDRKLRQVGSLISRRFDEGFFRDCHGDMHLGNLVRLPSGITAFDCIEFNADLRNIDVICDIAFLVMDLVARERHDLAFHFLNRYLERAGDYGGVALLDLYVTYRFLVRAKVAAIRAREHAEGSARDADIAEAHRYCALAGHYLDREPPLLVVMCGLSGSGKTWISAQLMAALPAIRIRSDVERKRMFGLGETAGSGSGVEEGLYAPGSSDLVYARLLDLGRSVLESSHSVILDAAFLRSAARDAAIRMARDCGCEAVIVQVTAPEPVLRERIRRRAEEKSDASEAGIAVLEHQFRTAEPPADEETRRTIVVDGGNDIDANEIAGRIREVSSQKRGSSPAT